MMLSASKQVLSDSEMELGDKVGNTLQNEVC